MSTVEYRRALDAAVREYERALADRAALDVRLAQLQQTIGTLTRLCGLTPTVAFGLTDACRLVLRGAGRPMTPVEVRDRLAAIGYDLNRYANPLAAIHTVLKRLAEADEATRSRADAASRVAYAIAPPARPDRPPGPTTADTGRARHRVRAHERGMARKG